MLWQVSASRGFRPLLTAISGRRSVCPAALDQSQWLVVAGPCVWQHLVKVASPRATLQGGEASHPGAGDWAYWVREAGTRIQAGPLSRCQGRLGTSPLV